MTPKFWNRKLGTFGEAACTIANCEYKGRHVFYRKWLPRDKRRLPVFYIRWNENHTRRARFYKQIHFWSKYWLKSYHCF